MTLWVTNVESLTFLGSSHGFGRLLYSHASSSVHRLWRFTGNWGITGRIRACRRMQIPAFFKLWLCIFLLRHKRSLGPILGFVEALKTLLPAVVCTDSEGLLAFGESQTEWGSVERCKQQNLINFDLSGIGWLLYRNFTETQTFLGASPSFSRSS